MFPKLKDIFLLLNFLSIILAAPTNEETSYQHVEPDPDLERYLREAVENFRSQMKTGIPLINMPVLDPLELKDLDLKVKEDLATMDINIQEMTLGGLSLFEFREIKPDLETFYLQLKLFLPKLTSFGKYTLNGKTMSIFPLDGNGDFSINVTEATIGGKGQLTFANDTLLLTNLELDLRWSYMKIYLENFLGGGKFSEWIQQLMPRIGKAVFDIFKPEILGKMNRALMDAVNEEMTKPEVKRIVEGLIPK